MNFAMNLLRCKNNSISLPDSSLSEEPSSLHVGSTALDAGNVFFRVQRMGETIFAAMFFVALTQAAVALAQYRTNPSGQLIIPPGATYGTAFPENQQRRVATSKSSKVGVQRSNSTQKDPMPEKNSIRSEARDAIATDENNSNISTDTSQYSRIVHRINRWLILLIPVANQKLGWLLRRNTHLFHFGFIMTLAGLFDVPNRWIASFQQGALPPSESLRNVSERSPSSVAALMKPSWNTRISDLFSAVTNTFRGSSKSSLGEKRIIVIGDSLAVGLGSVGIFDATKNNSMPFYRIENVDPSAKRNRGSGPVFPRAIAETLSNLSKKSVHWRSAGVDGGDIAHIHEHCLGLIEEELQRGHNPDAVVVLCGMNDLKYFVSSPFRQAGPRAFRKRLHRLIRAIENLSPDTKIILPMFPTQMFRANSPLNIFPLNFFLDGVVGFWDSQKKLVTDRYPSPNVMYVGLRPSEIYSWYQSKDQSAISEQRTYMEEDKKTSSLAMNQDEGLIALDGIHPNAKCYTMWGKFLGRELWESFQTPAVSHKSSRQQNISS